MKDGLFWMGQTFLMNAIMGSLGLITLSPMQQLFSGVLLIPVFLYLCYTDPKE